MNSTQLTQFHPQKSQHDSSTNAKKQFGVVEYVRQTHHGFANVIKRDDLIDPNSGQSQPRSRKKINKFFVPILGSFTLLCNGKRQICQEEKMTLFFF
jgi:hypothetical protein